MPAERSDLGGRGVEVVHHQVEMQPVLAGLRLGYLLKGDRQALARGSEDDVLTAGEPRPDLDAQQRAPEQSELLGILHPSRSKVSDQLPRHQKVKGQLLRFSLFS